MSADKTFDYWKCRPCHGVGKIIVAGQVRICPECDGTGNALVDGRARAHRRAVERIEEAERAQMKRNPAL